MPDGCNHEITKTKHYNYETTTLRVSTCRKCGIATEITSKERKR